MLLRRAACTGLLGVGLAACGNRQSGDTVATATPAAVADGASSLAKPAAGLPGYRARTDDPKKSVSDIKFATTPSGALDVDDGTHNQNLGHIFYNDADSASGTYTVRTEIDQLGAPEHPEAVGILVGGSDLAGPGQRYGYFIVRGDGQYSVKRRDRDSAFVVVPFTASATVPKMDAQRHVTYHLTVRVDPDSVRFLIADKPVVAVVRSAIPTDGVAGFRVNHGLHVVATPLVISH
jgi:hypothetical protein